MIVGSSLSADYAFGHALERDTAAVVKANDGKVLGAVKHPLNTVRFLLVPAAGAVVPGESGRACLRRGHHQLVKQAPEFGIVAGGQKLAALFLFINDILARGPNPRRA